MSTYTYAKVQKAVQRGGSLRGAAKLLKKSPTALAWWLARNGLRIERRAVLVPIAFELTEKGKHAAMADQTVQTPKAREVVEAKQHMDLDRVQG